MIPPARALVDHEARYGVLTTFAVLGGKPNLELASLYRVQRGHPLRLLGRWRFDRDNDHLPARAHRLFVAMAPHFGLELQPSTWQQLFDTTDPRSPRTTSRRWAATRPASRASPSNSRKSRCRP